MDPDLHISGGEGGRGGGAVIKTLRIAGGGAGSEKKFFRLFGPQFGLKISGGAGGPPLDPPLYIMFFLSIEALLFLVIGQVTPTNLVQVLHISKH